MEVKKGSGKNGEKTAEDSDDSGGRRGFLGFASHGDEDAIKAGERQSEEVIH